MQKKSQTSWYSTFFAYFVLFIALLHFFVYTSCCTNILVQEYLIRESENLRQASLQQTLIYLIAPELLAYLLDLERRIKKEEKLLSEADPESASSTQEKPESSSPPFRLKQSISGISFTFFLTLAPPPSGAAAAAAAAST